MNGHETVSKALDIFSHEGNVNRNYLVIHLTPAGMTTSKSAMATKAGEKVKKGAPSLALGGSVNWHSPLGSFLKHWT